ncbi:hypothetical protein MetMK1DRAFT_00023880 [Metallosphaera yellowstonensis MK1]|uniref:Uncharacterized protein n=1 Tax=Metallosphaera yellowstonensis MK1 TaxID=671065 RepID=H2C740_9CREN|nr:hypothetical protein MetMK1DRAFT_00023880 [Metallosphaera yellowstonensis MK1]
MKAQSDFIAFLVVIILVVVILIPIAFLVLTFSEPSARQPDFTTVLTRQVNGGSILLFFNSTPSKSTLIVLRGGNQNYTLDALFYDNHGIWDNISNVITPPIPSPLIHNYTLPSYVWNKTILVQVGGYNVSIFALILPNETASV